MKTNRGGGTHGAGRPFLALQQVIGALGGTWANAGWRPSAASGVVRSSRRFTGPVGALALMLAVLARPAGAQTIYQAFDSLPSWTSTDAGGGTDATYSSVAGGISGNCLQATHGTSSGSGARVIVYTVPSSVTLAMSVYMKNSQASGGSWWHECAYKLGSNTANDYNGNAGTWTLIKKFDNTTGGNSGVWTQYTASVATGANTQISIGFKAGGTTSITVLWDSFTTATYGAATASGCASSFTGPTGDTPITYSSSDYINSRPVAVNEFLGGFNNPATLTDGGSASCANSGEYICNDSANSSIEYHFEPASITKAHAFAQWTDGRAGLGYQLWLYTPANNTWTALPDILNNAASNISSTAWLLDSGMTNLGTNVTRARFVFHPNGASGSVVREIDLFGTANAGETIGSLNNANFATTWTAGTQTPGTSATTVNEPTTGWFVLDWGATAASSAGPTAVNNSVNELNTGAPQTTRCKWEFNGSGSGTDNVIAKEIAWGAATNATIAAWCAGRTWVSSTGSMNIGAVPAGAGKSWADTSSNRATAITGAQSTDTTWRALAVNFNKSSGSTFTAMLDANPSGTAWNNQFTQFLAFTPPPAPTVGSPTGTSLAVTVNASAGDPQGTPALTYAISIGGGAYTLGTNYVQANGSVSTTAVWQTKATWATVTVSGLASSTTYNFQTKAAIDTSGTGATALSASGSGTTTGCTPPATPGAPTVNGATSTSLNVANNGSDSGTAFFAFSVGGGAYTLGTSFVKADGTVATAGPAVWQTKSTWATKTVTGLACNSTYTFETKAANDGSGTCPSSFGSTATGTTSACDLSAPTISGITPSATCADAAGTITVTATVSDPDNLSLSGIYLPNTGSNLLTNPGFETNDFTGWTNTSNPAYGIGNAYPTPGTAKDGTKWAGTSCGFASGIKTPELRQAVTVTAGTKYLLSAWFQADGSPNTSTGTLKWKDGTVAGDGLGTSLTLTPNSGTSATVGWQHLYGVVTPTQTTLTIILITSWDCSGSGGGGNWDYVEVRPMVNPATWASNTATWNSVTVPTVSFGYPFVVWATDSVGNAAQAQATTLLYNNPSVPTSPNASPATICSGGSSTLSATAGSGGDQVFWYTVSCGGTQVGAGAGNQSVSPTVTTTYYARTKNSTSGCFSTNCATTTVTVNALPSAPTSPSASPATICNGGSSTLSATAGSGGDQVFWYTVSCGGTQVGAGAGNQSVSPTTTTTYYARTKNSTTGCFSSTCVTVTVTVNALPSVPTSPSASPATICNGQSSTLSATAGAGGDQVFWYTVSCGGTQVGAGAGNQSVSPTTTTTYYARTKNSTTGCFSSTCATATVTVNALPTTPTITPTAGTNPSCAGASITLDAGAGYTTYSWSPGGATTRTITVSPSSTTVYTVTVTNAASCSATSAGYTQTVNALPTPTITETAGTNPSCAGASITLDAGAGYSTYSWSPGGATTRTITVSPSATTGYTVTVTNGNGCSGTSPTYTQTVNALPAPTITETAGTNPSCAGASITLDAGAGYSTYSWSPGGATTQTITVSPSSTTVYTVTVTDGNGCSGTSAGYTQTVNTAPSVSIDPSNAIARTGMTAMFQVVASGTSLTYQWQVNTGSGWNDVTDGSGGTTDTYTTVAATYPTMNGYQYRCVVSGAAPCSPATSNPATLTVDNYSPILQIDSPSPARICSGGTNYTQFLLHYTDQDGGDALTVNLTTAQVHLNLGGGLSGGTVSVLDGTTTTPTVKVTGVAGDGTFTIGVDGGAATDQAAQSDAGASSTSATVETVPSIGDQPQPLTVCVGQQAQFSVTAVGVGTVSYQWRKGGNNIDGATAASFTISSPTTDDAGSYDCLVSDDCGSIASGAATLAVNTAAAVSIGPSDATACLGSTVQFSVTATGSPAPTYQWQVSTNNGNDWNNVSDGSGGTTASYTTPTITGAMDGYQYQCVVSNSCGSANSNPATLTVSQPSAPTAASAAPPAICAGQSSMLSATPGSGGDQVWWYTDSCGGTPVGAGPGDQSVSPTTTTTYYARTKDSTAGCYSTDCATVTVVVNTLPASPTGAAADPMTICSGDSSTLSATVNDGETVDWYTGSCGGTAVPGGASPAVSPTATTTYYAQARNTTTGCLSATCATVTVTVEDLPAAPTGATADPSVILASESSTLTASPGAGGDAVDWYSDSCGGTSVGSGSVVVQPTVTTTYYARTRSTSTACVSAGCTTVTVTISTSSHPTIASWQSVRTHGAAGPLAITLDPVDNHTPVSDPRRYGIQEIVVQFSEAVAPTDGLLDNDVTVTDSQSGSYTPTSLALTNNNQTLEILFDAGVLPDQKRYTFELAGKFKSQATGLLLGGDTNCQVRSLVGDANGDGAVNLVDMALVKSKNGANVTVGSNMRSDINATGVITLIDMALTKSLNGNAAP